MSDNDKKPIRNSTAEFLIITGQAGEQSIEARYENKTVWLTQKLMAELFAVDVRTISEHLKNIFASGELSEESAIRKFRNTAADGKSYLTQFYNLEAIISVGYRVNSLRATQFRQWATQVDALLPDAPRILLATGKLVGEGFDHPPLDTLVLAMPVSWKGTLQQYAGPLHREHASKTDVRIVDFVDAGHPALLRMWDKRQRGYRAMGYRIASQFAPDGQMPAALLTS